MKRSKVNKAMDHLDDELILGALQTKQEKTTQKGGRKMTHTFNTWKKWAAVAAAFVILLTGSVFAASMLGIGNKNTIVAFDVNPSLELEVNDLEEVVKVNAINEDAVKVLGELKLEGVDLNTAVSAILGSMVKNGYITVDKNSILISVDSGDANKATQLQNKVSSEVSAILGGANIDASVITQQFDKNKRDEKAGVSSAKMALVKKILAAGVTDAHGVPYTEEALLELKVHDLKLILDSKKVAVKDINSIGDAALGEYMTREEALSIAYEKAGVTAEEATRVEVELDYEKRLGGMLYEVDFYVGNVEHEIEINAKTGEVVDYEFNEKGNDRYDDYDDYVSAPENAIGNQKAIDIALKDAGYEQGEVRDLDVELEKKGGKAVYEVDFEVGNQEYEYEIDAESGEILKNKVEKDD